jgi:hypothetical protein
LARQRSGIERAARPATVCAEWTRKERRVSWGTLVSVTIILFLFGLFTFVLWTKQYSHAERFQPKLGAIKMDRSALVKELGGKNILNKIFLSLN